MFITDLREASSCRYGYGRGEDLLCKKRRKVWTHRRQAFVECGDIEKSRQICGLHTEELYERYCKEHKLENIIHDCVCEIKKPEKNCVICDIEQLENYEKVKGKPFYPPS